MSRRIDYIDYAKCFGMIAIMWGHIKLTGLSNSFVYAWHIPLFFFLSGLVFSKEKYNDFTTFLKKKARSLLVPYLFFSILTWMFWAGFSYLTHAEVESYWMPLLQTFIAQGSGGFLIHNVPLWFVTCLFMVEVVYFFIAKLPDWANILTCVLLAVLGYCAIEYSTFFDFTLLPWNLEVVSLALIFYAVGNLVTENVGHEKLVEWSKTHKLSGWSIVVIGFALTLIASKFNGSVSMGHANLHNPLLFYPAAFVGLAAVIVLCLLAETSSWNQNNGKIVRFLKWFGRNSFNAMAIHNPIKGVCVVVVGSVLGISSMAVASNTIASLLAFVGTFIATVVCMWLINRIKGISLFTRKK